MFQAGTLYLDGRSCDLCIHVNDAGKHGLLAGCAKTYLAYADCSRPSTGEKMTIAAAFTGGDNDNLFVGRNGLFYDRQGRDWDATITKIIDNPISIRQAFWSPYKKLSGGSRSRSPSARRRPTRPPARELQTAATDRGGAAAEGRAARPAEEARHRRGGRARRGGRRPHGGPRRARSRPSSGSASGCRSESSAWSS